ncbi:MAG: DUF4129 domain-containing protein, partial [Pseudomonadales bacterium]|nr:DUF4129 domain-containing protein [Pseudomonadales bacterium]
LVAASLFGVRPRRRRDAATVAYLQTCERLAARGLERRRGEGPLDYARRVAAMRPELGAELQALTADYVALSYGGADAAQRGALMRRLRQSVRAFRPRRGSPSP